MGPYNQPLFQSVAVLDYYPPTSTAAGTVNGNAIDFSAVEQLEAVVQAGTLGASATVDFKFQYSKDGSTNWTDIDASKCKITQITANNKIARLALRQEALASLVVDAAAGARYVRGVLTVGVATSQVGFLVQGADAGFEPVAQHSAIASQYLYTKSAGQP